MVGKTAGDSALVVRASRADVAVWRRSRRASRRSGRSSRARTWATRAATALRARAA